MKPFRDPTGYARQTNPVGSFCLLLLCVAVSTFAADRPPNIVYIISDDQTWSDFGFMGNERVHTPNLDKLASQSARFPNGYLPTSVCRPSLVSLMTGLYPYQHQVHFNHGPPGNSAYNRMETVAEYESAREKEFALIAAVPTLPGLLSKEQGYRCLQTGKFWEGHWRNGGFTEGMTTFTAPPKSQTYGGVRKLKNGVRVAHGNGDHGLQIGRETMQPIYDFVSDCESKNTPWLVWYAPYLPHQPHDSPEKFYEIAKAMPGVKEHEVPYFASIAQFDETVGDLIAFVEKSSDLKNTLFVFVSDNGWSPSEKRERNRPQEFAHTKTSKRAPFDEGVRSPILIRWDNHVQPATHAELVSSIDIVPTLLTAAGNSPPIDMPGKNLLGNLAPDRPVFGEIYPGDASSLGNPKRDLAYKFVRQGDYKLILPIGEKPWGSYLTEPALYDVAHDPGETKNRIDDPQLEAVVSDLTGLLSTFGP